MLIKMEGMNVPVTMDSLLIQSNGQMAKWQ